MKYLPIFAVVLVLACGRSYTTTERAAESEGAAGAPAHIGGESAELGGASSGGDHAGDGGLGGQESTGGSEASSGGTDAAGGSVSVDGCDPQPLEALQVEPGKCSVTSSVLYCSPSIDAPEMVINGELRQTNDFDAPGPVRWELPEGSTETVLLTCYKPSDTCEWNEGTMNWDC